MFVWGGGVAHLGQLFWGGSEGEPHVTLAAGTCVHTPYIQYSTVHTRVVSSWRADSYRYGSGTVGQAQRAAAGVSLPVL